MLRGQGSHIEAVSACTAFLGSASRAGIEGQQDPINDVNDRATGCKVRGGDGRAGADRLQLQLQHSASTYSLALEKLDTHSWQRGLGLAARMGACRLQSCTGGWGHAGQTWGLLHEQRSFVTCPSASRNSWISKVCTRAGRTTRPASTKTVSESRVPPGACTSADEHEAELRV